MSLLTEDVSFDDLFLTQLLDDWDDIGVLCWDSSGEIEWISKGFTLLTAVSSTAGDLGIGDFWNKFRQCCTPDPGELASLAGERKSVEFHYRLPQTEGSRWLRLETRQIGPRSALTVRDLGDTDATSANASAFLNLPIAAAITGPDQRIKHANRSMRELLGHPEQQLVGQTIRQFHADKYQNDCQQHLPGSTSVESPFGSCLTQYRRANGETFFGDTMISPLRDGGGTLVGHVVVIRDATGQLENETALEENLSLLEGIFGQIPVALAVIDKQRQVIRVSDAALSMVGLEAEELIGQSTRILYPDEQTYRQAHEDLYPPRKTPVRTRGQRKNGKEFDAEITMSPLLDENNDIKAYIAAIEDVTQRLQQEEEVERYGKIVNASSDALAFIDTGFHYLAVNSAYLKMWQMKRQDVIGRRVPDIVGIEVFEKTIKTHLLAALAGQTTSFVADVDFVPGGNRIVEAMYDPYRTHRGTVAGVVVNIRDVTLRKRTETRLVESEQRFRQLAENIRQVFWLVEWPQNELVYVSPSVKDIWGVSAEDLHRDRKAWTCRVHPDDIERVNAAFLSIEKNRRMDVKYRIVQPDGSERLVQDRGFPVFNPDGKIYRVAGLAEDITEQDRISREIFALSQIVEQSPDAVLLTDNDFRIIYLNPSFEKLFGWSLDELRGRTPDILNAQADADDHQSALYQRILSGETVTDTAINRRKDGSLFHCEYQVAARRDERGEIIGYMGSQRDVTDRFTSEQLRLKLMQEREVLLDYSPALIIFKDLDNNIIRVTESVAQTTGLPREQIEGRHSSEIYPDMADQYFQDDLEVIRSGVPKRGIIEPLPLRDGTHRWLSTDKIPHRDEQGEIDGIVVFAVDITAVKNAELALAESEHKYRTLFERIAQGVVIHAPDGQILDCNPAAERILGYTRGQLLDMSSQAAEWKCIHEDGSDFPGDDHPVMQALRTGAPVERTVVGVLNPRNEDYIWLNVDAVPLFDNGQQSPSGAFASFTDITEEHELQQALIQSQKFEAVGRLTSGIAHDFNNILGGVLGFTDLAKRHDAARDEKLFHYLEQIETAGFRARDLVRQLLIYSRGERTDATRPILVTPILKEIVKLLKPVFPANITITLGLPGEDLHTLADPLHLHQILMNLCLNAKSAMPNGGNA